MDENDLLIKIAEIRSYIASDWPTVEERKRLYSVLNQLAESLKEVRDASEKTKRQED